MKIFESIKLTIKLKSFQNKNQAALECLIECGFLLPEIRKALMVLNGIRMADLSDGRSIVTASNTIKGRRRNEAVMAGLSERLGVGVDRLFPESGE